MDIRLLWIFNAHDCRRRIGTHGSFDSATKTLWVATGHQVMQLDRSGETIRHIDLFLPQGEPPLHADGLLVDRDFIRAATALHGTFEFSKPH